MSAWESEEAVEVERIGDERRNKWQSGRGGGHRHERPLHRFRGPRSHPTHVRRSLYLRHQQRLLPSQHRPSIPDQRWVSRLLYLCSRLLALQLISNKPGM